jgi:hypothetical protein
MFDLLLDGAVANPDGLLELKPLQGMCLRGRERFKAPARLLPAGHRHGVHSWT